LRASRLASDSLLVRCVAAWLLVALALYAGFRALLPAGLLTPWQIFLAVFLWMPASRLALAPLSLHWNRHR
jgi:hypothetical protein